MVINFINGLGVSQFLTFNSKSEVVLFDLWKFGKDKFGKGYIYEKNTLGEWEKKSFTKCEITLCLNNGVIEMPDMNPLELDDMVQFEYKLAQWTLNFRDAVNTKLKELYAEKYGVKITKSIHDSFDYFIHQVIGRTNYENYGTKVYQLHDFFQDVFSNDMAQKILSHIGDKVYLRNVMNLSVHENAMNTFNEFMPKHFALMRVVDGEDLIRRMVDTDFVNQMQFASFLLKSIDDVVNYSDDDYKFLIDMNHKSLCTLLTDKENFILWFKLFLDVSKKCCFVKIDELYSTFMHIGLKQCLKNKEYVTAVFDYFQRKQFHQNTYDLSYAIQYGVIGNCLNWKIKSTKKVTNFIADLENSILDIRRTEIVHNFLKLSDQGYYRFSLADVICKKTQELWDNCLILCGLSHTDQECKGLSFTIYKDGEHSLLLGGSLGMGQSTSLYMETLIGGENCFYLRQHCEKYFNSVMRV